MDPMGQSSMELDPTTDPAQQSPTQPPQPPIAPGQTPQMNIPTHEQRMDRYRNLLSSLAYSVGKGLEAANQNPRGRAQRTQAGMGAALMAPFQVSQAKQAMELSKASEARQKAQADASIATQGRESLKLPEILQQLIANNQKTQAQTGLIGAQTGTEQVKPAQVQAQTGLTTAQTATEALKPALVGAQTDVANSQAQRNKFMSTPTGLYDLSGESPTQVPGTDANARIPITKDLIKELGLPPGIEGENLRTSELNVFIQKMKPDYRIVTMEDGIYRVDIKTGEKLKLGPRPPREALGQFTALTDPYGQVQTFINPASGKVFKVPGDQPMFKGSEPQARLDKAASLQYLVDQAEFMQDVAPKHPAIIGRGTGDIVKFASDWMEMDPEINAMIRTSADMADMLGRMRSGATLRPDEEKRLTALLPQINQPKSKFNSNLEGFLNYAKQLMAGQANRGSGKPLPNQNPPVKPPPNVPSTVSEPDFVIGADGKPVRNPKKPK